MRSRTPQGGEPCQSTQWSSLYSPEEEEYRQDHAESYATGTDSSDVDAEPGAVGGRGKVGDGLVAAKEAETSGEEGWTVMRRKPNSHQRRAIRAAKDQEEERLRRLSVLRSICRAGPVEGPRMVAFHQLGPRAQQTVHVAWSVLQCQGAQSPDQKACTVEAILGETVGIELGTEGRTTS